MTLANRITLARIVITPIFFVFFQVATQKLLNVPDYLQVFLLLSLLLLFIASELSDLLDGIAARRMAQVSGVGKLMDPFGDVLSRVTYFFCFYQVGIMPTYAFILILWREISMLFVRQLVQLSGQGPLPARRAGKVKAVIYFAATTLSLLVFFFLNWPGVSNLALGSATGSLMAELRSSEVCSFTLDSRYYQNLAVGSYAVIRFWLLPLSFLISVLVSWYSFILYLRDFLPTLRHNKLL